MSRNTTYITYLEYLVNQQYRDYFETCPAIDLTQIGYKAGHNKQNFLLSPTNNVKKRMDRKQPIDISKGFDSVYHVTLLRKLQAIKVTVCMRLPNYKDQSQEVPYIFNFRLSVEKKTVVDTRRTSIIDTLSVWTLSRADNSTYLGIFFTHVRWSKAQTEDQVATRRVVLNLVVFHLAKVYYHIVLGSVTISFLNQMIETIRGFAMQNDTPIAFHTPVTAERFKYYFPKKRWTTLVVRKAPCGLFLE